MQCCFNFVASIWVWSNMFNLFLPWNLETNTVGTTQCFGLLNKYSWFNFDDVLGAVIAMLREHKGDYGLQRIYASIGGMISSPISGLLIDYASENKGYTDFRYFKCCWKYL